MDTAPFYLLSLSYRDYLGMELGWRVGISTHIGTGFISIQNQIDTEYRRRIKTGPLHTVNLDF